MEYKSHSSIRRTPKIGPELGAKFFHDYLKHLTELHEDTDSNHKSFGLTVVKTMFPMFMHESPCLFVAFHGFRISLTDKIIKERHLIRIIWDSRVENPVFPIINEVMTLTGCLDLSS